MKEEEKGNPPRISPALGRPKRKMTTAEAMLWIRTPAGQAAMAKARAEAEAAIEKMNNPQRPQGCTCCPLHSRRW